MAEKNVKIVKIENSEITAKLFGSFDVNTRMLEKAFDVKYWYEDKKVVRLCTTFATKEETVMELVSLL